MAGPYKLGFIIGSVRCGLRPSGCLHRLEAMKQTRETKRRFKARAHARELAEQAKQEYALKTLQDKLNTKSQEKQGFLRRAANKVKSVLNRIGGKKG